MANNTLVAEQIEAYYGSTHDAELVLPLAMVTEHHGPNPAKKNTKKVLGAVMIRLTGGGGLERLVVRFHPGVFRMSTHRTLVSSPGSWWCQ